MKYLIIFAILFYFIFFTSFPEGLENVDKDTLPQTKQIFINAKCEGCSAWNNKDAQSVCDATCLKNNPDKYIRSSKNWKRIDNDIECGCKYIGHLYSTYAGCPIGESDDPNACFIWNDKEAQQKCPEFCNKYLPGKHSKWTGNWKNTSSQTSACECQSYQNKLVI